jgi:hypothetical protein
MTWEEEVADQFGITEQHDETCHGEYLCREHFIEKLAEARKKEEADPATGPLLVTGPRIPGTNGSGSVEVKANKTWLFKRRRPMGTA